LGVTLVVAGVAVLIAGGRGMFHGRLPPDTLPKNEAQAEDVAFSVASNAGCGDFNSEYASGDNWQFECWTGGVAYTVYVYGGDEARSQGLAQLQADGRPYVATAYYAVTVPLQGVDKFAAMSATPPPASIMDPFR
jgi:hypothetical protein